MGPSLNGLECFDTLYIYIDCGGEPHFKSQKKTAIDFDKQANDDDDDTPSINNISYHFISMECWITPTEIGIRMDGTDTRLGIHIDSLLTHIENVDCGTIC